MAVNREFLSRKYRSNIINGANMIKIVIENRYVSYLLCTCKCIFLVGAFRRKTQTIVVTFSKTNEVTDFISFIS